MAGNKRKMSQLTNKKFFHFKKKNRTNHRKTYNYDPNLLVSSSLKPLTSVLFTPPNNLFAFVQKKKKGKEKKKKTEKPPNNRKKKFFLTKKTSNENPKL